MPHPADNEPAEQLQNTMLSPDDPLKFFFGLSTPRVDAVSEYPLDHSTPLSQASGSEWLTAGAQLVNILSDPKGPEVVVSEMPDDQLAELLDALFQNLDSPAAEPSAVFWYEIGVAESHRRGN